MINVLFGLSVVATYELDFVDEVDTLRSNLLFVGFASFTRVMGHTRQTLVGLLQDCETSDTQESRLSTETRSRPWNDLLKSGLAEALSLGIAGLPNALVALPTVPIDDYHSNVQAQWKL